MPGRRSDYPTLRRMQTRWSDNDAYGHMNNAVHYRFFDSAVTLHMIDEGVFDPTGSDQIYLVVESGCRYFAALGFPEEVTVGVRVGHLGTSSVRYEIALFGGDRDEASAEGFFVHVNVDRGSGVKAPIPEAQRAVLDALRT